MQLRAINLWVICLLFSGCGGLFSPKEKLIPGKWEIYRHYYAGKYLFPDASIEFEECAADCQGLLIYEADSSQILWTLNSGGQSLILEDTSATLNGNWQITKLSKSSLVLTQASGNAKIVIECIR